MNFVNPTDWYTQTVELIRSTRPDMADHAELVTLGKHLAKAQVRGYCSLIPAPESGEHLVIGLLVLLDRCRTIEKEAMQIHRLGEQKLAGKLGRLAFYMPVTIRRLAKQLTAAGVLPQGNSLSTEPPARGGRYLLKQNRCPRVAPATLRERAMAALAQRAEAA